MEWRRDVKKKKKKAIASPRRCVAAASGLIGCWMMRVGARRKMNRSKRKDALGEVITTCC